MIGSEKRTILLFRDLKKFQGGHLKVWEYYHHLKASETFRPLIHFTENSLWTPEANPWFEERDEVLTQAKETDPDAYFLAGLDWLQLPPEQREKSTKPIINFIQHLRHADPEHPLSESLGYRAIRICVSREVEEAILTTGKVNGPVFTIPNGLNIQLLPPEIPMEKRDIPLLIAGFKAPTLAKKLSLRIQKFGIPSLCVTDSLPRTEYLSLVARSELAVFLPHLTEGYFLPAIEAMALGVPFVCPDCSGNRSFCIDRVNCWRPPPDEIAIARSIQEMHSSTAAERAGIRKAALKTAAEHSLGLERTRFLNILSHLEELWR